MKNKKSDGYDSIQKITFERLLALHKNKIVDPHMIDIFVRPEQMFKQACQDWFETSEEVKEEEEIQEELPQQQDVANLFKVSWKKAKAVFDCSRGSLQRNTIPGVKWHGSGAIKNREALVVVNLNHPMLSGFGLSKTHFVNGKKMFYGSKEVQNLFGFKTQNSVYSQFDDSETLRIGRHLKFPVTLTHEKIDERERILEEHYQVDPISFPLEVFSEGES